MKLLDAHSHINFRAYEADVEETIARAREQGIGMLAVGSQYATSQSAVSCAEAHEDMWAVVGLHPTNLVSSHEDEAEALGAAKETAFDAEKYRALAKSSKKVVAIGECGLDYFHTDIPGITLDELKRRQKEAFRQHLDLALELSLPVMIHCREAHDDLADILEEYDQAGKRVRGNIHCFTGSWKEAQRYLALDMCISFTGVITFKPKKAEVERGETLQDVVKKVPLEKLLVETDCPYLAPEPYRGKRNEPAYVAYVAAKVAELKGIAVEEVERQTLANARTLFRI
jgi:TatD DNase family protein